LYFYEHNTDHRVAKMIDIYFVALAFHLILLVLCPFARTLVAVWDACFLGYRGFLPQCKATLCIDLRFRSDEGFYTVCLKWPHISMHCMAPAPTFLSACSPRRHITFPIF